jgi:hypothetical protein
VRLRASSSVGCANKKKMQTNILVIWLGCNGKYIDWITTKNMVNTKEFVERFEEIKTRWFLSNKA